MRYKKYIFTLLLLLVIAYSISSISAMELNNDSSNVISIEDMELDDIGVSDDYSLNLDETNLFDSTEGQDASDEGYVVYVGSNNITQNGNGSSENPFVNLSLACKNISGQEKVTVKIYAGTYKLGEFLKFNTSNLNIEGIGGEVIIKNLYNSYTSRDCYHGEAFGLTSDSSNFTISNIIFDASEWTINKFIDMPNRNVYCYFVPFYGY